MASFLDGDLSSGIFINVSISLTSTAPILDEGGDI